MGLAAWIGLLLLGLTVFYWKKIYEFIVNRRKMYAAIAKFDGPPSIPILGTVDLFKTTPAEFQTKLIEYASTYVKGDAQMYRVWAGPYPMILTIHPDAVKAVLESNVVLTKGPEYTVLKKWLGTGLLTSTGDKWIGIHGPLLETVLRRVERSEGQTTRAGGRAQPYKWRTRRKLLTPAFHFNVLNGFMTIFDEQSRIMVTQLEKEADTRAEFNFFPYMKRCALDIICATSMGASVNAQTNTNHPYVIGVQRLNELSFEYLRTPWLWIDFIWDHFGNGKEYKRTLKMVTDFTRKVIEERSQKFREQKAKGEQVAFDDSEYVSKKKLAFLDLLLNVQDEGKLTDEDIREEVDTFMFEGHDTTSSGMAWTIWALANHKQFQDKVLEEIDQVFGDSDRDCTNEDLTKLKYLEKCIKESLRLFPPVPLHSRTVESDFELNGMLIPAGTTIMVPQFVIQKDNANFPNALEYNPANFDQENIAKRHPFSYVPFSAGPRNCIGQKFALMEEKTVLSWFFRRYTVTAEGPMDRNLPCTEIILKPSLGCPVKIFKRTK